MEKISLKDFQNKIFDYLSEKNEDSSSLKFVKESKGIKRKIRLDTYKSSFVNRTVDCVITDFEVTGLFLGVDSFYEYLEEYFKVHPSKTHFINEISRHLPSYIEKNLPKKAEPFIIPLAKMEWLMNESFYNFFSIDKKENIQVPKGETKIKINPSLIFLESRWPLSKIWNKEKAYEAEESFMTIWTLSDRKVRILDWSELEFKVLKALKSSISLEGAISELESIGSIDEMTDIFSTKLPGWIDLGLLEAG